jgi:hypothetical protein
VCTQNARSALTESISVPKLRRDNTTFPFARSAKRLVQGVHSHPQEFKTLHKDLVQGVHRFEIRLSVEGTLQGVKESEEENARRARGNSLQEILRILSYQNP